MCNKHSIIASTLTIFNVLEFQCEQLSSLISNIFINVIYNLLYIIYIFCVLYFLRRNFSTHCDRDREMERKRKKKGKERTREREDLYPSLIAHMCGSRACREVEGRKKQEERKRENNDGTRGC